MEIRYFKKDNLIRILYHTDSYSTMQIEEYSNTEHVVSPQRTFADDNSGELRKFVSQANNNTLVDWVECQISDFSFPLQYTLRNLVNSYETRKNLKLSL